MENAIWHILCSVDINVMLSTELHNSQIQNQWHYLPLTFGARWKIKAVRIFYKTFPNLIALTILLTALVLVHLLS
jgi:hypothetical protein